MSRRYEHITSEGVKQLLGQLIEPTLDAAHYADTMYKLGFAFGPILMKRFKETAAVTLACTVEDADFLAKGIIDYLEQHNSQVFLNVFWNKRFKPGGISVAPIVKQYQDRESKSTDSLIIIKSIISSSCVVRTNLTRLIEAFVPRQILVVAPVLMRGSLEKLASEFDRQISQKFEYIYFAEDDQKTKDGIIIPGIGGDIYKRLGFLNQDAKNRYIPAIVKERRQRASR
jgi:hypothetical protein